MIAAAGINADNADIIIAGTGVHGVHAGSSVMSTVSHDTIPMPAHDDRSNKTATMGTNVNFADDMKWDAVDEAKVARYVNCANEGFSTFKRNQRLLPAPTLPADCTTDYIDLCPMYS